MMELNVLERQMLLNIIPAEGDIVTMKIVKNLRMDLSPSEDELAKFPFDINANQTIGQYHPDKEFSTEIEIGPKAHLIISEAFEKLSKEKKLKEAHISLYEKFVGE